MAVINGEPPARMPPELLQAARRRLAAVAAADHIEELPSPPGNRLELLRGDRAGQYSIRLNSQWRLCFFWRDGAAWDIEIVDYH